jgi:DNA transformation protein and related proteins
MSVSPSFRAFVLEQLSRLDPLVRARSMFGGVGIYSGELFFALIDEDTVYFKADDSNRPDFIARGMQPFQPGGAAGETMQYYEVPPDLLEDAEALRSWVEKAVDVARRKRAARSHRSSPGGQRGGKNR